MYTPEFTNKVIRNVKGLEVFTVRNVRLMPLTGESSIIGVPANTHGTIIEDNDFGAMVKFTRKGGNIVVGYVTDNASLAFVNPLN